MQQTTKHTIIAICALVTFVIPVIELAMGFQYIVKDGQDPNIKCQAAPDLPLLLAISGVYALFFFGTAYGFLKMISSVGKVQSDVSGKGPAIIVGLVSFIFGAVTLIFFILIQMRVYEAYSMKVQSNTRPAKNFCRAAIIQGALAMVILTYINIIIFLFIVGLIFTGVQRRVRVKKQTDMELLETYQTGRL